MANSGAIGPGSFGQTLLGSTTTTPPNSTQQLLGTLGAGVAPQTDNAQLQFQLGQNQLSQVGPNLGVTQAYNNAMSGYQAQNLGLSEQGLGIQQTGLQEQGAQQQAQQGFEQQQYALQSGQFPEQQAEAALAYQNSLRNTQGAQAIGGTQNTVGGRADVSTLGQQYGFQQQDIARAQALSQLGQQSEESGYGYSQEQLQNAQQGLSLSAKANGLSEQQLSTMLNYQNQQAGVSAQQDVTGLLSNLGNIASGNLSNLGGNLGQVGYATNLSQQTGVNLLAGGGY